jgi:hypothetical protein
MPMILAASAYLKQVRELLINRRKGPLHPGY